MRLDELFFFSCRVTWSGADQGLVDWTLAGVARCQQRRAESQVAGDRRELPFLTAQPSTGTRYGRYYTFGSTVDASMCSLTLALAEPTRKCLWSATLYALSVSIRWLAKTVESES